MQAELWKKERELKGQHKEIADLQMQVWHMFADPGSPEYENLGFLEHTLVQVLFLILIWLMVLIYLGLQDI
jgi:hypothetical protein